MGRLSDSGQAGRGEPEPGSGRRRQQQQPGVGDGRTAAPERMAQSYRRGQHHLETSENAMDFETAESTRGCRNEIMHRKDLNLQEEEIDSDDFSEDGQSKQKAEKRRAKKKRQRERKKLEKKKHLEENEQEPEWDVNSAFVANAASHIRPKTRSKLDKKHNANKENEEKAQEDDCTDSLIQRGQYLAEQGINSVEDGNYTKAIALFSEAIKLDPKDYRYFGNRSYCYEQLKLYPKALVDADVSIQLSAACPKGYFRKGRALRGCNRYAEAERAFRMVLQLDEGCEEALKEIHTCQILQLLDHGFTHEQSISLLEEYESVAAVMEAPVSAKVLQENVNLQEMGEEELLFGNELSETQSCSLWVGNITDQITEKQLRDLFKFYGEIHSIRLLGERFCAFVNFKCPIATAKALEALQGKEIENTRLLIRYPDKPYRPSTVSTSEAQTKAAVINAKRKVTAKTNECYYWRSSGCSYGEKCRYRHIPENKGVDRKPWKS
ncbi:stress-induced-phosphoprotein 1-like isoform X2 [Pseudophryne corroboree]|uniref:stress-induced-phosphoprotein 1-like isoform X2 n=1 Tax=Pseudophryne corroboree TaxID=495146 RepID=UPI003081F789